MSEVQAAQAENVRVTDEELIVDLVDGRTVTVPVQWYPRLANGTPAERCNWRLIGRGEGIHWPDLDEDIGVEDLLAGRPSGESQTSLHRWLKSRIRSLEAPGEGSRSPRAALDSEPRSGARGRRGGSVGPGD